jgi:hypothetical protein
VTLRHLETLHDPKRFLAFYSPFTRDGWLIVSQHSVLSFGNRTQRRHRLRNLSSSRPLLPHQKWFSALFCRYSPPSSTIFLLKSSFKDHQESFVASAECVKYRQDGEHNGENQGVSIYEDMKELYAKIYCRIEEEMRRTQSKYPAIPLLPDIYFIYSSI